MADWPLRGDGQRYEKNSANYGIGVTDGTPAHTKGSYAELIASTAFDAAGFCLTIRTVDATEKYLLDIAVGAGGSEEIIVADYPVSSIVNANGSAAFFNIPIPAGTRVAASIQSTVTTGEITVGILFAGKGSLPSAPFSRCETWGAVSATSKGTPVNAGAIANTKGVWVELIASTAFDVGEIIVVAGNNDNFALASIIYSVDIGVGAGGSEEVIIEGLQGAGDGTSDMFWPPSFPLMPVHIPAGSRVVSRIAATTTDATDRILDVTALGVG